METILAKRLINSAVKNEASRIFLGVIIFLFSSVFILSRVGYFSPYGGDIAVWIFTHEWLSRGYTLYEGVWDHKDWGFFAITQPFFQMAGIKGLYVAALLSVYIFMTGIFLLIRHIASFTKSVLVSILAGITFTSSPSFLATYTENLSISLSVLALGLILKYPFLSGSVFALSMSVKISGILVFLVIFVLHLLIQYFILQQPSLALCKRLARITIGFLLITLLILVTTYLQGELKGWLEVISYNSEYGKIRRGPTPPISDIIDFLKFASAGDAVNIFLVCLGVTTLTLCALTQKNIPWRQDEGSQSQNSAEPLILAAGLTFTTLAVMMIQFPPSFQHWQYFVGGVITLTSVLVSILGATSSSKKLHRKVLASVLLPIIAGSAVAISGQGSNGFYQGATRWLGNIDRGEEVSTLQEVPTKSTIAFINSGSSLFNLNNLPKDIKLGCKFFYNFPHLLPRYGDEMLECLRKDLDYVILRKSPLLDAAFLEKALAILEKKYHECSVAEDEFRLWVSKKSSCT